MYLTPKEKEIGRENFRKAMQDGLSRRDFIKGGITAGVVSGASLGAFYFGYEASVGNPLRVGVIGTGDEGSVLIGAVNPDYIQVKAIADLRPYNIHRAFHGHYRSDGSLVEPRPGLLRKYGWKTEDEARKHVKVYEGDKGDYRELIANAKQDGIEAVIIALPLHLHAPAAIAAMEAGLHVLTEKLMAHSVAECKQMARAAKQTRRHLATGHQRHYNILYNDAVETIKRGVLGELHYIRAQWHRSNMPDRDSWKMPLPPGVKTLDEDPDAEKLLKDLKNWEKKLAEAESAADRDKAQRMVDQLAAQIEDRVVEAAKFEYQDAKWKMADGKIYRRPALEELIRWRLFDRTGGGLMAELGSHQLDAAGIFISAAHGGPDKVRPLAVVAASNRPIFGQDRDVDDHVCCIFELAQEDRRAVRVDQRQRLWRVRGDRVRHKGNADPGTGTGGNALQRRRGHQGRGRRRGRPNHGHPGKSGRSRHCRGPDRPRQRESRLHRTVGALGMVHPQEPKRLRPGHPTQVPSQGGPGRRGNRAYHQHCRQNGPASRLQRGLVRPGRRRGPGRRHQEDIDEKANNHGPQSRTKGHWEGKLPRGDRK